MIDAARAENWDSLDDLDRQRRRCLACLDAQQPTPEQAQHLHAALREVKALDERLIELVRQERAERLQALRRVRRKTGAADSYRRLQRG